MPQVKATEPEAIRAWLVERYGDYGSATNPKCEGHHHHLCRSMHAPLLLILLAVVLLRTPSVTGSRAQVTRLGYPCLARLALSRFRGAWSGRSRRLRQGVVEGRSAAALLVGHRPASHFKASPGTPTSALPKPWRSNALIPQARQLVARPAVSLTSEGGSVAANRWVSDHRRCALPVSRPSMHDCLPGWCSGAVERESEQWRGLCSALGQQSHAAHARGQTCTPRRATMPMASAGQRSNPQLPWAAVLPWTGISLAEQRRYRLARRSCTVGTRICPSRRLSRNGSRNWSPNWPRRRRSKPRPLRAQLATDTKQLNEQSNLPANKWRDSLVVRLIAGTRSSLPPSTIVSRPTGGSLHEE